jgi:hypothetical protein
MDEKAQAEGERRVRERLIEPLERLGLARPTTLTKAQFETMKRELAQRLAPMTGPALDDLRIWCERNPGGKGRDRFPIALKIMEQARDVQEPDSTDASPLIRKVFAHETGRVAIEKGYAPELLKHLKKKREWPGAWTVKEIREAADDTVRQFRDLEMRDARGDALDRDDQKFLMVRRAAFRACQDISDLSLGELAG